MAGEKESPSKRSRRDSIYNDVLNEFKDYKRMKVGDHKWAKVDKLISKDST